VCSQLSFLHDLMTERKQRSLSNAFKCKPCISFRAFSVLRSLRPSKEETTKRIFIKCTFSLYLEDLVTQTVYLTSSHTNLNTLCIIKRKCYPTKPTQMNTKEKGSKHILFHSCINISSCGNRKNYLFTQKYRGHLNANIILSCTVDCRNG